ncbi:MAG TPA: PaaI family thioesterase [Acidimicrobiales bacterium]|nr:PaaI family thioesterase [Acidimicrobiales bacterium]
MPLTDPPDDAPVDALPPEVVTPASEAWPEWLRKAQADPPTPRRAQLHRTGNALRGIVDRLHGSPAPAEELDAVATELERLADRLEAFPKRSVYEGFGEATLAGREPFAFFDHSPMLGRANPLAPPISLWADGDVLWAEAHFGSAYEGPPGCVHGGYVAAAFDEVLGSAQSLGGRPGMTARLCIDYRSPTPLHTDLRFEARVTRMEGRKTFTRGTLHAGDRLCAEAEGLFVAVDISKVAELRAQREAAFGDDDGA